MTENVHVSRRTLAKGAAWAAPVVAVATAAPKLAASICYQSADVTGIPTNSGANWQVTITVKNQGVPAPRALCVTITDQSRAVTVTAPTATGLTVTTISPSTGSSKTWIFSMKNSGGGLSAGTYVFSFTGNNNDTVTVGLDCC